MPGSKGSTRARIRLTAWAGYLGLVMSVFGTVNGEPLHGKAALQS